jgi:hypothetical protein
MKAYYQVQERDTGTVRAQFKFLYDAVDFWGMNYNSLMIVPMDSIAENNIRYMAETYLINFQLRLSFYNREWFGK